MADLAAQLKTIASHVRALRDAGVSTVKIGDVEFTLQPLIPEGVPTTKDEAPKKALDDAATYGYADGSSLPGFRDPRKATP